ncbi:S8 family serine peptidase [Actinoplanes sp. NBRC 103695]|uniref:S8 family serine peptidase n=1 Tax=Actinoplanes sp. NBRC 103695 TaxID=3032202 RepID=UPI0024A2D3CC|nr:S8 family serine peptidase [Actinoplanes sp. NBRC 103695]GLZ01995.1 hypothetical protein Acsp02_92460 [Actinoplanes sp. NBRC 103695]
MSAARAARIRRSSSRVAAVFVAALLGAGVCASPSHATEEELVQYYTVGSSSETLSQIADEFLSSSGRSTEIFNLNTGRRQPVGGSLSDPDRLRAGWYLMLPWDAVGPGVQYGVLPKTAPAPNSGTDSSSGSGSPSGSGSSGGPGTPAGASGPGPGATGQGVRPDGPGAPLVAGAARPNPAALPKTPPLRPSASSKCVAATAASKPSHWGMSRLTADRAWQYGRGTGQLIAVVDSGVDGRAPQLSGRVAIGANIVTGDGRGDTDCLGTGTAMAGLMAAAPQGELTFAGVAPEAVVMPVRVVTDGKTVDEASQAAAIEVAVSAGATVIAIGSYVDVTRDAVARSVRTALEHNIVVVAGAPTSDRPAGAALPDGVILVGGVAADGKTAADYAPQTVDVVAPGVNVTSIGVNGAPTFVGSGTQYAVALAAGTAALIRSTHPALTADQVANRLAATAEKMTGSQYGHGMITPVAAVTRELPGEAAPPPSDAAADRQVSGGDGVRVAFLVTVLAGLLLSTLLVFRFRRTMSRAAAEGDDALDRDWPGAAEPAVATGSR